MSTPIFKRGEIVKVIAPGDFGKPRPAVILQSDLFNDDAPSYTIVLCTGELVNAPLFRVTVLPSQENNLEKVTQIMVDKIVTVKPSRLSAPIGILTNHELSTLEGAIKLWLGLL